MEKIIAGLIKKGLEGKKIKLSEKEIEKLIEIPPSSEMGDYSFPCFFLSKKLRKNPNEIALGLKESIGDLEKEVEDAKVVGGYVNFFLNNKLFAEKIVKEILIKKENFGKSDIGKGKMALIEHTSINPNASPHVGRSRNAIIGDSIVRIFSFMNFRPEVHYYVNDVSKQIAMLVLAEAENLKFEDMLKKYIDISKKVSESKKLENQVFELLEKFERGDKKIVKKFNKIARICVNGQEKILSDLGIKYDFFDYESSYIKDTKKILEKLKKTKKLFQDKGGRFVLDQKGTIIEGKMKTPVLVLTRSDGTGLYPLRDIVYTIEKMKTKEKNIIVLGEDQKLYFLQIKEALKLLGMEAPEVVHYSFVLLSGKGISRKMSTRRGDVVLLEKFLKDTFKKAKSKKVGIAAVKYSILKNSPNKMILFDLEKALKFEGDTGPYLLYSYARASSILKKSGKQNIKVFEIGNIENSEIELVKKLSQFPEVVLNSYNNLNPSLIANYSYELSKSFNEFYHDSKVIGSEEESFRISLVVAFKYVLKNSLNLLGIDVLEKM